MMTCALLCSPGQTCYANSTAAMDCLNSIPFNRAWANATIDVVTQSLENFGFGALYHATGPPYSINLDIMGELANTQAMIDVDAFANDLDFQEHVQNVFQLTLDAHTRYRKPACYTANFVQPFAFDIQVVPGSSPDNGSSQNPAVTSMDTEPRLFIMENLYTEQYLVQYPEAPNLADYLGQEILLLDGLEATTAIAQWGDSHETRSNNAGARFNSAVRSYLYRSSQQSSILPMTDLQVTLVNGTELTLPWLAAYSDGLADPSVCAAPPADTVSTTAEETPAPVRPLTRAQAAPSLDLHPPTLLHPDTLHSERADREQIVPADSPYYLSCFVQTVSSSNATIAGVSRVLVMKVASFSPPGDNYTDAWEHFLGSAETCLSQEFDLVVVDVMQNGGGYVCLGLRLIELLVEDYEDDHTLVQMNYDLPHSPLMDAYIATNNKPNPYPDPEMVEQILDQATQQPFVDGEAYYYPGRNVTMGGVTSWRTNIFSLDCTEAEAMPANGFRPSTFMPPEKLIILTDGTCGSTCASFTKIPQEAGKATFVGAGGLWHESMDVSSFAGGFVCNPSYLQNIAYWSNLTFPSFLTNQAWQFGWAAWYSAKLPSRPVQFTVGN
mmetsp:Transcript_20191/g.34062  ORF Transcript_20191/g.34062 Transcript_20191/m.34062 type:complete len:609 (-) Transcript_20191:42-1868(-)